MKKIIPVFLIIIVLSIYGCGSSAKKLSKTPNDETAEKTQAGKLPKWLPKDFDPKNDIILIEKADGGQQKKIQEFMTADYPYKYEFINMGILKGEKYASLINADKYADKKVYRFMLVHSMTSIISRQGEVGVTHAQGNIFDYNFIDRLNDITYPKTGSTSSWAFKTLRSIINKIIQYK
jgi:hypothetical protein